MSIKGRAVASAARTTAASQPLKRHRVCCVLCVCCPDSSRAGGRLLVPSTQRNAHAPFLVSSRPPESRRVLRLALDPTPPLRAENPKATRGPPPQKAPRPLTCCLRGDCLPAALLGIPRPLAARAIQSRPPAAPAGITGSGGGRRRMLPKCDARARAGRLRKRGNRRRGQGFDGVCVPRRHLACVDCDVDSPFRRRPARSQTEQPNNNTCPRAWALLLRTKRAKARIGAGTATLTDGMCAFGGPLAGNARGGLFVARAPQSNRARRPKSRNCWG